MNLIFSIRSESSIMPIDLFVISSCDISLLKIMHEMLLPNINDNIFRAERYVLNLWKNSAVLRV